MKIHCCFLLNIKHGASQLYLEGASNCLAPVLYTPCLKKTVQNCFCQNFVKFTPILTICDRKMENRLKLENVAIIAMYCHLRPPDVIA